MRITVSELMKFAYRAFWCAFAFRSCFMFTAYTNNKVSLTIIICLMAIRLGYAIGAIIKGRTTAKMIQTIYKWYYASMTMYCFSFCLVLLADNINGPVTIRGIVNTITILGFSIIINLLLYAHAKETISWAQNITVEQQQTIEQIKDKTLRTKDDENKN